MEIDQARTHLMAQKARCEVRNILDNIQSGLITIDRDGNVGIGVARPEHPLELASGAYVTAGGAWTNSSSFFVSSGSNLEASP